MAPCAERRNPLAIFVTTRPGPFFDERMFQLGISGIATMAPGTGKAAPEMNVVDKVSQVEMSGRFVGPGWKDKERSRFLDFRIRMAEDAVILQKHFHFLWSQPKSQDGTKMIRASDDLRLRHGIEELTNAVIERVEIGPLFGSDHGLAVSTFGRK